MTNQTVAETSFAVPEFPSRLCLDHGVSVEVGMTACTHVEAFPCTFEPASFECEVAAESS